MKSEDIQEGWVDDWQVRNKKDCHPSSAIHIIKTKDVLEIIDKHNYDLQNVELNGRKLTKDELIDKASLLILIKKDLIKKISGLIK